MSLLENNPKLGHITTFGGNPVIAAAAYATLKEIRDTNVISQIAHKEALFRKALDHPKIKQINGKGLMLAPILSHAEEANHVVLRCLEKGLLLFWLLWEKRAIRLSPPLTISEEDIVKGCQIIKEILDEL